MDDSLQVEVAAGVEPVFLDHRKQVVAALSDPQPPYHDSQPCRVPHLLPVACLTVACGESLGL